MLFLIQPIIPIIRVISLFSSLRTFIYRKFAGAANEPMLRFGFAISLPLFIHRIECQIQLQGCRLVLASVYQGLLPPRSSWHRHPQGLGDEIVPARSFASDDGQGDLPIFFFYLVDSFVDPFVVCIYVFVLFFFVFFVLNFLSLMAIIV